MSRVGLFRSVTSKRLLGDLPYTGNESQGLGLKRTHLLSFLDNRLQRIPSIRQHPVFKCTTFENSLNDKPPITRIV